METMPDTSSPSPPATAPAAAPARPLLELTGITKTFQTDDVQTNALASIDLTITTGEFVSISGPSGSGK